ncbi:MAG: hypothetical protein ACLFPQ_03170 [Candidatus Woesearchaeota archaeon]
MKFKIVFALFLLLIVALGCDQVSDNYVDVSSGVIRTFPDEVSAGEIFTVTLDIRLTEEQTYYLLEDMIPNGFSLVDSDKNKVKLIEIQNAESTIEEYSVTAPEEPGTYSFSGEYAVEGMADPEAIMGKTSIVVN